MTRMCPGRSRRHRRPATRTPRRRAPVRAGDLRARPAGIEVFLGRDGRSARGAGEPDEAPMAAVEHTMEVPGDPDRPGQRSGAQPDAGSISSNSSSASRPGPVPLVDHSDDRYPTLPTHLEQLEGLRFKTFGGIDEHDRTVDGGRARGRCPRRSLRDRGCRAG